MTGPGMTSSMLMSHFEIRTIGVGAVTMEQTSQELAMIPNQYQVLSEHCA